MKRSTSLPSMKPTNTYLNCEFILHNKNDTSLADQNKYLKTEKDLLNIVREPYLRASQSFSVIDKLNFEPNNITRAWSSTNDEIILIDSNNAPNSSEVDSSSKHFKTSLQKEDFIINNEESKTRNKINDNSDPRFSEYNVDSSDAAKSKFKNKEAYFGVNRKMLPRCNYVDHSDNICLDEPVPEAPKVDRSFEWDWLDDHTPCDYNKYQQNSYLSYLGDFTEYLPFLKFSNWQTKPTPEKLPVEETTITQSDRGDTLPAIGTFTIECLGKPVEGLVLLNNPPNLAKQNED